MPALAYRVTKPSSEDQAIIDRVAEAVQKGHPIQTAGRMAGIGGSTASMWLLKGSQEIDRGEEHGSHVAFAEAVKQAEAELVDAMLTHIHDAAEADHKHWTAAMTLLERRSPGFSKNQRIEIEQHVTHHVELPAGPEQSLLEIVQKHITSGLPLLPAPGGTHSPDN